jgi:hypothetical protein
MAQDRGWWWALANTVMNLYFPLRAGYFFADSTNSFSRKTVLHEVSYLLPLRKYTTSQRSVD